jgi:hypothetical protein
MITGDSYRAMEYGPVPGETYDLTKVVRGSGFLVILLFPRRE